MNSNHHERIQTRFKGDCDDKDIELYLAGYDKREFRPDLKGIATKKVWCPQCCQFNPREFRPDLKGIATNLFYLDFYNIFLREFRPDLKGIAT